MRPLPFATAALLGAALLLAVGCPGDDPEPDLLHVQVQPECDNLNPLYCMLPWPSSRYLVADDGTATGWRIAYEPEAFALNFQEDPMDVEPYNRLDGFPPSAQILTMWETTVDRQVDDANLPPWWDYDASLAADSPTVILDMETGERVAHFAEFDVRFDDPEQVLMYLRPAARLEEDRRYAVAIRDLEYDDGTMVPPSEVFAALRDGVTTDSDQVEARRPGFEEVFAALADAGVERDSLIQAWDFHTASGEMLWGDLLAMRDDAMERVGAEGLSCTIEQIQDDYDDQIYRRVDGTFTVPLYMDSPYAPARLVRGADGEPEYQGDMEVRFRVMIPRSLAEPDAEPGALMTYGHGFFGSPGEIDAGWLGDIADDQGYVLVATEWQGMSEWDVASAAAALADVSNFPAITERLMQGVTNALVLTRTMAGVCADEEAFVVEGHATFDPDERYYMGMSQGGIMGGVVMALSQDIERGVLNVGASIYPMMQGRSINFDEFELIYAAWYHRRIDRDFYWSVMGHLWDASEPITYLPHVIDDPFPDTPPKKILYQVGLNDAQVCNLASDVSARTLGLPLLTPSPRDVWGVEEAPATPYDGSAYQYWDCGDPDAPLGNEPPEDNSAHECVRRTDTMHAQIEAFLQPDGVVINACDGECDPD